MAAAVNSVAASHHQHQRFPPPLSRRPHYSHQHHLVPTPFSSSFSSSSPSLKTRKNRAWPPLTSTSITQTQTQRAANNSKTNHLLVVSVAASENSSSSSSSSNDSVDEQQDLPAAAAAVGADLTVKLNRSSTSQVGGFAFEGNGGGSSSSSLIGDMVDTAASSTSTSLPLSLFQGQDFDKMADRAINAAIVLAAGTFAITKLLTIDSDYWQGWTLYEILRYAPLHNWTAYEEALKTNPVLAKMMISGVVYSVGDWIAQCYEGKRLFDFDRARMFRSGLVGFSLHGSLSHYYYYFCEALFPFQDWWVVPVKVLFDQTVWAAIWNSIYYVVLGFLRFESPVTIFGELKATFWPMLTAGWKLWPFAHLITYGVIPVEQRLLWVDCVELVWVTILSTYSNEKSEARHSEVLSDSNTRSLEE